MAKIGRYQILSELGEGGFGKVYLALDPALNSRRAIKVLSAPHDPDLRVRFKNEAIAAASLNHPGVVRILEYGEEGDWPFIVMEYLEGRDLAKRLASGPPFTLFQKITILQQVASGIHAAHSHPSKIIHRDIKPANVMILSDGTAKIMDFGIARLAGESKTRLTATNVMIGSVSYMAPEQFNSGLSDAVSDIWSFGVLAYELIAEQHPFPGIDVTQVMYRITSAEPLPLNEIVLASPPELTAIISKAMCKDRAQRYQSLEDVAFDLDALRVDLRRSEAERLLRQAQDLFASGDLEAALKAVRDALEVDNQSRAARELREKLQVGIHRRAIEERIGTGLRNVSDALGRGDIDRAVAELEHVCTLAPNDRLLQERLKELRAAQQRRRQTESILRAAEPSLAALDLDAASAAVERAAGIDPDAPELAAFRDRVEQAQVLKKRRVDVNRMVRESDQLAAKGSFGPAIQLIAQGLALYPDEPALLECSKRYAELARREYAGLENVRSAIKQFLEGGEYARAKALCLESIRRYPDYEDFQILLKKIETAEQASEYARQQQEAEAKSNQEISRLLIEIRRAFATLRPEEAVRRAQEAAKRFPEEPEFRVLLQDARAMIDEGYKAYERRTVEEAADDSTDRSVAGISPAPIRQQSSSSRRILLWAGVPAVVVAVGLAAYLSLRSGGEATGGGTQTGTSAWSVSPTNLEFENRPGRLIDAKQIMIRPAQNIEVSSPEWVSVEQSLTKEATILSVGIRGDRLPAGSAAGSLTLRTAAGSAESVTIRVASAALPPPSVGGPSSAGFIRADPAAIEFTASQKEAEIAVKSDGPPRRLSIFADSDWIALGSRTVTTPAVIRITARTEKLNPGAHMGLLTLKPADPGLATAIVRVRTTVPDAPTPTPRGGTTSLVTDTVPVPVVKTPVTVKQRWTGGLEGELRIRRASRAGEVVEVTSASLGIDGFSEFPWLYDTRVQVRVISPSSVVVETQPGKSNDWNLIRLRVGSEPVQLIIVGWQILP